MNPVRAIVMAMSLFAGFHAMGQEPLASAIPAGKGAVDPSGKFVPAGAATTPAPGTDPAAEEKKARESLLVQQEGATRFRIGQVVFDRKRREVTIPAVVNMETGIVEYALVAETGKVHEALFSTPVNPREIHLACLLLGMPAAPSDTGLDVKVNVAWDTNGPEVLHELANLVVTSDTPDAPVDAKPLPGGAWRYVGSKVGPGGFAAAAEGSVISLIQDPAALVVNPRESAMRDDVHTANRTLIPRKGSPVRIILTLPAPPAKP
jgi:hypothetical protein